MRKGFLLAVFMLTRAIPAIAIDLIPDGVNASYGQYLSVVKNREADYNYYRLGAVWDWNHTLVQSDAIKLNGYFELAGSVWKSQLQTSDNPSPDGKDSANAISFSPVFRLSPSSPLWGNTSPFIDAGAGAAWVSEIDLEKKKKSPINLGGHWLFELRLMVGLLFGRQQQFEFSYGWLHYSNAHINQQNESIDFHTVTVGWRW